MTTRPPLTDAIVVAVSQLVDDSQGDRRDPAHSDIEFQIDNAGLEPADPGRKNSKPVGKSKRVRGTLSWALSSNPSAGEKLVAGLVATVQGHGGFRATSINYCGAEAIANLVSAFAAQGWDLLPDGSLQPKVLDSLSSRELTAALRAYADRAQRGALDSPLLAGTAKDLLEATASHVLVQKWGSYPSTSNFPTLLGQAFTALGFATPSDAIASGEPVHKRMERAAYELGCALNAMRNKEGTGHGRPWLSSITPAQAKFSVESMGNIASLMLDALNPCTWVTFT
ncbi:abortive infection family protein [Acidithiobacillus ferrivorans]|uniref:abortive infection family protein n=1 Tax=Acidithiobacillus ferrivorans TaxID=160808 RepID=UPI001C078476|nr:abortive infection family protein [Acidithiobacillus ferrivorans]MBU2851188.1 abortive infection family protein [Acidithiobacillus ferrivorans]